MPLQRGRYGSSDAFDNTLRTIVCRKQRTNEPKLNVNNEHARKSSVKYPIIVRILNSIVNIYAVNFPNILAVWKQQNT